MNDYYALLDVPFRAGARAIKKSFRQKAFATHPDKNKEPGAADRFIELVEAYEILSDPARRKHYDGLYETYVLGAYAPAVAPPDGTLRQWTVLSHATARAYADDFPLFHRAVMVDTVWSMVLDVGRLDNSISLAGLVTGLVGILSIIKFLLLGQWGGVLWGIVLVAVAYGIVRAKFNSEYNQNTHYHRSKRQKPNKG